MRKDGGSVISLLENLAGFMRKCIFRILSVGPIPNHIAFIMDGNRRYSKKRNMDRGAGHRAGYSSLMAILMYSCELGVKYLTVYAFSIDNFKREPEEVHFLMNLLLEKIDELLEQQSIVNRYGIRVYFIGNLKLLSEPVRIAAEKAMKASANNTKYALLICVAYTSCDEIVHAVQNSCQDKLDEVLALNASKACNCVMLKENGKINGGFMHDIQEPGEDICNESPELFASRPYNGVVASESIKNENGVTDIDSCSKIWNGVQALNLCKNCNGGLVVEESEIKQGKHPVIKLVDIEKHMYMSVAPDPDIVIRTSGETRLSNFLLWQSANSPLYSPAALWPEIGLWHLIWAVLNFQRTHSYLDKKKKQS